MIVVETDVKTEIELEQTDLQEVLDDIALFDFIPGVVDGEWIRTDRIVSVREDV